MYAEGLRAKAFVFGLVCIFGGSLALVYYNALTKIPTQNNYSNRGIDTSEGLMESDVSKGKYQKRVARVKRVCAEKERPTDQTTDLSIFYSDKYRLAGQIVPKVGSTSLISIFKILNDRATEEVLEKARMAVHNSRENKMDRKIFDVEEHWNFTVLVPSRDPYTRLYSAFVDKVYMADDIKLTQSVLKRANKFGNYAKWWRHNVRFQMFLDYIFDRSIPKHELNSHYKPIINRHVYAWLCSLNDFILIKQESFSSDIEYALKKVKVEKYKMEIIKSILQSRRTETTIIGTVKTEMNKLKQRFHSMKQFKNSTNRYDASIFLLEKMWKTFQIQGHINVKSNFPHEKFSPKRFVFDDNYILKTFLEEIKRNPLTPFESERQRQEAVLAAYGGIEKETIDMIQNLYELDFRAFGYKHMHFNE